MAEEFRNNAHSRDALACIVLKYVTVLQLQYVVFSERHDRVSMVLTGSTSMSQFTFSDSTFCAQT
jgi:hypothetical protein